MAWSIEGRYFENCSCNVVCPCTASLSLGADYDRCQAALAFHVDSGEVEGVDVSGLTLVAVADAPKFMHEGNWRLGVLIDDAASDEQAGKLGAVFGGALGGPMGALSGLISEQLGVERVPMEFSSTGGRHSLTVGDRGRVAVEDVVPFGVESGEPAQLTGIFHPAGPDLTIAKADPDSSLNAFDIPLEIGGKSGFSHQFAWSAAAPAPRSPSRAIAARSFDCGERSWPSSRCCWRWPPSLGSLRTCGWPGWTPVRAPTRARSGST